MIRGTTPTLEFELPFEVALLAEAWITLSQRGDVVLDKRLCDCRASENKLTLRLTQDETLKLRCDCITEIQVRVRTLEGDALASDIIRADTHRILRDGVI